MKTDTTLTDAEQLAALRSAMRLLDVGNPHQAHVDLCAAIKDTPTESRCYPALVGAANWIDMGQPRRALVGIAQALLNLERETAFRCPTCPAVTQAEGPCPDCRAQEELL